MRTLQRLLSVFRRETNTPSADYRFQVDHFVTIKRFAVSPEEVTQRLGLTPTETHFEGDPICSRRTWQANHWELRAPSLNVDTAGMNREGSAGMIELVKTMHERLDAVRSICPPGEVSFTTIIATDHACPSVGLELETSRKIVELGATWHATIWPTSFEDEADK